VVVNDVPAPDLKIGDIVTVPRPGEAIPVSHRIIGIDSVVGNAAARSLTLQGDANDAPDRAPYEVEKVPRVLFGFAGVGIAVLALQTPLFMGAATLLVALFAVWAFWPDRRRRRSCRRRCPEGRWTWRQRSAQRIDALRIVGPLVSLRGRLPGLGSNSGCTANHPPENQLVRADLSRRRPSRPGSLPDCDSPGRTRGTRPYSGSTRRHRPSTPS